MHAREDPQTSPISEPGVTSLEEALADGIERYLAQIRSGGSLDPSEILRDAGEYRGVLAGLLEVVRKLEGLSP